MTPCLLLKPTNKDIKKHCFIISLKYKFPYISVFLVTYVKFKDHLCYQSVYKFDFLRNKKIDFGKC